MYVLLGQEVSFDYSTYGPVGAVLIIIAGFLAYLKHRDSEDRAERARIHEIVDKLGKHVEAMGAGLTTAFAAEMAAERGEHRKDLTQIGDMIHDIRGLASTAVSAKDYANQLEQKLAEKRKGDA
jgi:hypothetical protein